ncbi:MAG TPA: hypothetical protein VME46_13070 [Acidimicrobiales bacterium]|nr:hypothetical protein [Acidimicrobiales bacterium]
MDDPLATRDPEEDLDNAATARSLRELFQHFPPAPVSPEERSAAVRSAIDHAWEGGRPPADPAEHASLHHPAGVPAGHVHPAVDYSAGDHPELPPLSAEAAHPAAWEQHHDGGAHPHQA